MARENFAILYGQVRTKPRLGINNEGVEVSAILYIKVMRRPTNGQGFDSKLYVDLPPIRTRNPEMISKIRELEQGDMIMVCGPFTTREIHKRSICKHCGNENLSEGNVAYITPMYIRKEEPKQDDAEGIALLKANTEISNRVTIIGNVCREPRFYEDANHKTYAQYQIAVNRRYRIHEDPDDVKTDYPWIKTFGRQATEDSKCLDIGSSVYITGAVQTRDIERKTMCSHCSGEYEWNESVMEIVPYYIGYLANCNVSNEDAETSEVESLGLANVDLNQGEGYGEEISS